MKVIRTGMCVAACAALQACATFSPDGGMDEVRALAQAHLGAPGRAVGEADGVAAARVAELLREPLTADAAVEIALRNNPGLRARIAEVGIAEADLVQAGTLRNPVFAYANKRNADVTQIERSLLVNVAALLTMPLALEIEQRRFAQAKLAAAVDVVAAAAATRDAYFRAVASEQMLAYFDKVRIAAEAGRDLARRMVEAGNFARLAQMREESFYVEAVAQLERARHAAVIERERLARALGLAGTPAAFSLPAQLPELPKVPVTRPDAEQAAMDRRLDVRIAALESEGVARTLGLVKTTRFVNVLEAGYINESETGDARKNGYEIVLDIPLFDWGTARVARAEAVYRQALARAAQTANAARSEVRASLATYRTAFELARHYRDEIVPLRKRIAEEATLRYNGMLIGVFELLADAREQVASVNAAIEATRDFWLADTALQLALAAPADFAPTTARANAPASGGAAPRGH